MESSTPNSETMPASEIEFHGIVFSRQSNYVWKLLDLSYGVTLGHLSLVEGPGWVLDTSEVSFIDVGQMYSIIKFVEEHG